MKSTSCFLMTSILLVCLAAPVRAEEADPAEETMRGRTVVLTSPEMAGRGSGTPGAEAAAETLAVWMAELGLQPAFAGSWFQEVPLSGTGWSGEDLSGKTGRNVAGILPGSGLLAERFVVVGAHYDHLGRVTPAEGDVQPAAPGEYYPGANDNASGVAVVFDLMRRAAAVGDPSVSRRSVLFVSFVGEEVGLQGSGHMVNHLPVEGDRIDAMLNIDTVGQLTDNRLYISGVGTADAFASFVDKANINGFDLSLTTGGWSGSDHMSFNTREIPVLFIFGGAYPQYNRPTDDWPTLDFRSLTSVARYADRLLTLLREEPQDMPWIMIAEKNLREDENDSQNRDTWFGSLPDFTEEVAGYKLAGVFDESPAARAGLQKGDVLIRFGSAPVEDLATFTRAMRSYAPGDLVEVKVERDGRVINFTVVLGNRADRK